MNMMA